jgi:hypothetical protein
MDLIATDMTALTRPDFPAAAGICLVLQSNRFMSTAVLDGDVASLPQRAKETVMPPSYAAASGLPEWTASWWTGREAELHAALDVASTAAPHLQDLALFLIPRLPHQVRASSSIKGESEHAFSRLLPLAEALTHRWISFNSKQWLNTISADVDHADWKAPLLDLVANRGLPIPFMTVQSPWKGTAHIVWLLEHPILKKCAKQLRLRKGISRGLTLAFDACSRFGNALQKNPWHLSPDPVAADREIPCGDPEGWAAYLRAAAGTTYHTRALGLATVSGRDLLMPLLDLATDSKVTLLGPRVGQADTGSHHVPLATIGDDGEHPKGTRLFHRAARTVRRACTGNAVRILQIVERTAIAMNSPADRAAIEAISSSITVWMNSEWLGPLDGKPGIRDWTGGRNVDFGVMTGEAADKGGEALDAWRELSKAEKQRAGAVRSNAKRTAKVDGAIRAAIGAMLREGVKLSQRAVAARSGLSESTVHRRWKSLDMASMEAGEDPEDGTIRPSGKSISFPICPSATPASLAKDANTAIRNRLAAERPVILDYESQAARLLRRGADMEMVKPLQKDASRPLRAAYGNACRAERNLHRRILGRQARERALVTALERQNWHEAHRDDETAWQARLAALITRREEVVASYAGRTSVAESMDLMYSSIIKAEWRARRRARGEPEPIAMKARRRNTGSWHPGPDVIDLAIPW